ncbi:MAG: DUF2313 domain-containing protein, partial [Firmicutes bacterium]|nr:DUF2313 domain-containing protein [Bacillota bacterium]
MLKLMHKMYKNDKVTLDIIKAAGEKIKSTRDKIDELYAQIFLDYATWYLECKEREMDINKTPDDTDKRRAYVRTRLLGVGTATKGMLEGVANTVPGVKVEILFRNMTVILHFLKAENNKYLGVVKRSIETMIPYH